MKALFDKFEKSRPFSEDEAWFLFKVAAFSEAAGWTLLIIGIFSQRFLFHGSNTPVLLSGRIHGTLFLIYILASAGLYPSLGWSRWRGLAAAVASVPPYGSLLFEQWESHVRRTKAIKSQSSLVAFQYLLEQ